jgi:hypothetical protein
MRRPAAIFLVLALAVLALALVPATLASKGGNAGAGGKPGGGGGGSSTVSVDPAGPYHFGQAVYVTTNAPIYPNNTGPWISLECYQNGVKVGGADHAGFPGGWYYGDPFYLGPSQMWTGGAADCTVRVYHQQNRRTVTDATTSFHVEP